jgi:hypothetical protein
MVFYTLLKKFIVDIRSIASEYTTLVKKYLNKQRQLDDQDKAEEVKKDLTNLYE